ncbi:surfeit locus protein 6-domain-containing protein [Mrakia frigida]|uniref:surfeit locus protein 6-domain-containing protein n=1 Tax=Mrakia frigida TaxID=29902 RepID=UPI003FCC1FFD
MSSSLLASLESHNSAFEALLSLIPARHYIRDETMDDEHDNKYMKNKKNKSTPKQELKERSKKAKKDKLDPSNNLTVPELLNRAAQLEASTSTSSSSKKSKKTSKPTPESDASDEDDDSESDDVSMVDGDLATSSSHTSRQPIPEPTSVADLHAKLQARIASLQGKRFGTGANAGYEAGSKEELLEEARIRRGELREKRRKKTKEEKKLEKKQGGKDEGWKKKSADEKTVNPGKTVLLVPEIKTPAPSAAAGLTFNQFTLPSTFGASSSKPSVSANSKKGKPLPANPVHALAALTAQKAKLAGLPEEIRSEKEAAARWETALERAEGGKVRDDAGRLKKAAKRKEKEKAKSSTEWADRKEHLRSSQAVKQKKRSENISSRLEARKNIKKGIKPKGDKKSFKKDSGPSRGGFEGKKGPKHSGSSGKSAGGGKGGE